MSNNATILAVIKEKGLKKGYIADKIGISKQAFSRKLNGKTKWSAEDILVMKDLLDLTPSEAFEIFLARK